MKTQIRGSDVYVTADIERILSALAGASRRYGGEYGSGYGDALRDVAAGIGATTYERQLQEVAEYRAERITERYPATSVNMSGDSVDVALFNPASGRLVAREVGYGWIGNDGKTAFWSAADWQMVSVEEANAWGQLVPDDWCVLVRHAFAADKRRQLGQSVRVLPNERRQLR